MALGEVDCDRPPIFLASKKIKEGTPKLFYRTGHGAVVAFTCDDGEERLFKPDKYNQSAEAQAGELQHYTQNLSYGAIKKAFGPDWLSISVKITNKAIMKCHCRRL